MGTKVCKTCGKEKTLDHFYRHGAASKNAKQMHRGSCKECERKVFESNPHYRLKDRLRKYGLTIEQYGQMVQDQAGACAICGKVGELVIDHNHETGAVRELLCRKCNWMLGNANDDERILLQAVQYLRRH